MAIRGVGCLDVGEGLVIKVGGDLGLVTIGQKSLLFATMIPGDTLECWWPILNAESKVDIQRSSSEAIQIVPGAEKPEGQPFNELLLTSPPSRISHGYKRWIASMLRTDHHIVFTHGDLRPQNILVVDLTDGGVYLSGVIDWKASGFYPEYWERLKASTPVTLGTEATGGPTSVLLSLGVIGRRVV